MSFTYFDPEKPHRTAEGFRNSYKAGFFQQSPGDVGRPCHRAEQKGGSPRFFVPLGLKDWFACRGIADVVELDWWQSMQFKGVEVHFVPVQHWSKRTLSDENQTLWGGWVLRHPELSFFFAGDTGYSKDFAGIRGFGGFDLAAEREKAGVRPDEFFVLKHGETRTLRAHEQVEQAVAAQARH